jgi:outer membrane receptor protein involved in Fe transport
MNRRKRSWLAVFALWTVTVTVAPAAGFAGDAGPPAGADGGVAAPAAASDGGAGGPADVAPPSSPPPPPQPAAPPAPPIAVESGPIAGLKQRPAEAEEGRETVVTAGRRAEIVFQNARSVSVVVRRDIDERAVRTTPLALEATPGVFVQQTNYGGGAPVIRGQLGNRLLLLVDGIRLNNSTYRAGPNQFLNTIDPFSIDRIEVLRGLGSVANGSDAIGGTINVVTDTPQLGPGGRPSAQVQLRAGSADVSGVASGRVAWSGQRTGIVAIGSARHFGDLRAGNGLVQPFTAYDEWAAMTSGTWAPGGAQSGRRVSFSFQTDRQYDVPRSDRSFPGDFRLFARQTRQLTFLRFDQTLPQGIFKRLRATLSWNRQGERLDRYRIGRDQQTRDEATVDTLGAQIEMDVNASMPSGTPLTVGADFYWDRIATDASAGTISTGVFAPEPLAVRYPGGTGYATGALFLIHDVVATALWRLTLEGRLGAVRIDLPTDNRLSALDPAAPPLPPLTETVALYAAGLHARRAIGSNLAAYGGLTLGFRAPNVDDYSRLGAEGPAFVIPTRNLQPERAWSGEVGMKGDWAAARFSLAYAYTRITDALLRSPATLSGVTMIDDLPIGQVRNVESATYHSVEAAGVVPIWRRLTLSALAAYTRGSITSPVFSTDPAAPAVLVEFPANKVPPAFGRVGLGWRSATNLWFAEGHLRWALAQRRLGEIDLTDARICPAVPGTCTGTDGWVTIGLRGGVRLVEGVRLVAIADNLTDARYRLHASGIYAPGRSLILMLEGYL